MGPVHNAVDMTDGKAGIAYPRNTSVSDSSCLESLCTCSWPMCLLPSLLGVGCGQRTNLDTGSRICFQVPRAWSDLLNLKKRILATREKTGFNDIIKRN